MRLFVKEFDWRVAGIFSAYLQGRNVLRSISKLAVSRRAGCIDAELSLVERKIEVDLADFLLMAGKKVKYE